MKRKPAIVIHGGTGAMPDPGRLRKIRQSMKRICDRAREALAAGASSVDSVTLAVRLLEDDPLFNAGTGSVLQRDGKVRMSASLMDGASMRFAGVLNIERVRNPVLVAKFLLEEEDRILAGPEALQYARRLGFGDWDPATPKRRRQLQRDLEDQTEGTVGAVALDQEGRLAAATSTGGKPAARAGRVSDSGMPAGNYADDRVAVSCTGLGEQIVEYGLAVRIAQQVRDGGTLARAFSAHFRHLRSHNRRAGAIALDSSGRWQAATTYPFLLSASAR